MALSEQDQALTDTDQQFLYEVAGVVCYELRTNLPAHLAVLDVSELCSGVDSDSNSLRTESPVPSYEQY
jgi:hypothetical protein